MASGALGLPVRGPDRLLGVVARPGRAHGGERRARGVRPRADGAGELDPVPVRVAPRAAALAERGDRLLAPAGAHGARAPGTAARSPPSRRGRARSPRARRARRTRARSPGRPRRRSVTLQRACGASTVARSPATCASRQLPSPANGSPPRRERGDRLAAGEEQAERAALPVGGAAEPREAVQLRVGVAEREGDAVGRLARADVLVERSPAEPRRALDVDRGGLVVEVARAAERARTAGRERRRRASRPSSGGSPGAGTRAGSARASAAAGRAGPRCRRGSPA